MATECVILEQLLVVVRHSNEIQFHDIVLTADPCWMNVSVDEPLLVQVCHRVTKLTEVQYNLGRRERSLTE